jgi:LacI family transcriptional regulator
MATMVDVARKAGVSIATVSHVLNGTRTVRDSTKQSVLDAISELGYIRNNVARSLVTARSNSIGLAVSAITNPYFNAILQGAESAALESGYSLLIADPHDEPDHEYAVIQLLHQRRVDGMIVAPSAAPKQMVDYLVDHRVPVVFLDRLVGDSHDQVCAENACGMRELVTHMIEHGHRRIGLISGLDGLSTTDERITGYEEALRDNKIRLSRSLVLSGHSEAAGSYSAVGKMLAMRNPPTAFVTANNAMTIGALRALRDAGRRVPDDIALASFDDFEWADLFAPHLTAIAQPSKAIGAEAVRLLLTRLDNADLAPRTVRLPCQLVRRNSCGCP